MYMVTYIQVKESITKEDAMINWTRKTNEFEFAPYKSEDERFTIGDIRDCRRIFKEMNLDGIVSEYYELESHNWDTKETHNAYMKFCKENKIRFNGSNWILLDGDKVVGIYKTAKEAKTVAETL